MAKESGAGLENAKDDGRRSTPRNEDSGEMAKEGEAQPFSDIDTLENHVQYLRKEPWIGYPRATKLLEHMNELLELDADERAKRPGVLLVGPRRNGKSWIATRTGIEQVRAYDAALAGWYDGDEAVSVDISTLGPVAPVVCAKDSYLSETDGERRLYRSILAGISAPLGGDSTPEIDCRRVVAHLRCLGTKVLMLDNLQSLSQFYDNERERRRFFETVEALRLELGLGLIGVGEPHQVELTGYERKGQPLFDVHELPLWEYDDDDFRRLLASFEETFLFREPAGLTEPEVSRRLWELSDGSLGWLVELTTAAAIHALKRGDCRVDDAALGSAVRYTHHEYRRGAA